MSYDRVAIFWSILMSTLLEHTKLEDINSLLESQEKMIRGLRPGQTSGAVDKLLNWLAQI